MSLRFPYQKYPNPQAVGGFFFAASIPVSLGLPGRNAERSKRFEAVIDSGATQCIFHASIGRSLGLLIEKGEAVVANSLQGTTTIFLHDVTLFVPDGVVPVRAGFSDALPIAGLLGMTVFFDHFRVVFDPLALCVELERVHRA